MQRTLSVILTLVSAVVLALALVGMTGAQAPTPTVAPAFGSGFTYQGRLDGATGPVSATCDFQFQLFDAATAGAQVGATQTISDVVTTDGLFTVTLNGDQEFGASAFAAGPRWLGMAVQCPDDSAFVALSPRQPLTAAPFALSAASAGAIQGQPVSAVAPAAGQALVWDGSAWAPSSAVGPEGPEGPEGPQGAQGLQGPQGAGFTSGVMIMTDSITPPAGYTYTGMRVTAGLPAARDSLPGMPSSRYGYGFAALDGKLYAFGGFDSQNQALDITQVYDLAAGTWSDLANLNVARGYIAGATLNGKIYAVGGFAGGATILEVYDPAANTWTQLAPLPRGRFWHSVAVLGGKIYAIGGSGVGTSMDVYDPATDAWTAGADLSVCRREASSAALNGKIYVLGGDSCSSTPTASVEVYDPAADTWTAGTNMPTTREYLGTVGLYGKIYVMSSSGPVIAYDPVADSWATDSASSVSVAYSGSVVMNGRIFGSSWGSLTQYTPDNAPATLYVHELN